MCYLIVRNNTQNILLRNTSTVFSNSPCITAVTLTYPAFLLSRNTDPLVLFLWNQFSILQVREIALLLHVSNDRSTNIGLKLFSILVDSETHSMDEEITFAYNQGKHSLEICGTVSFHELLFGSQEDVGFKSENKRLSSLGDNQCQTLDHLNKPCVCKLTNNLPFSAFT